GLRFLDPVIEVANRERVVDTNLRLDPLAVLHRLAIAVFVGGAGPHRGLKQDLLAIGAPPRRARGSRRRSHSLRFAAAHDIEDVYLGDFVIITFSRKRNARRVGAPCWSALGTLARGQAPRRRAAVA